MEVFSLDKVIDREYPVATYTWSTGVTGTLLDLDFPDVLFAKPFISDKLKDFRLMKAGIRLSVRVSASQFLYGKLLVCYDPMVYNNSRASSLNNVYVASGYPHMLVSATSSEAGILDVPFISDKRALDINTYTSGEMGRFKIMVLNELRNITGEATTATIFVTAQFIDAQVFLPHDRFSPESKRIEANKKSKNHSISDVFEDLKPKDAGIETHKLVKPYADFFDTVVKPGLTIMSMAGLSKPTTLDTTTMCKINPYHDVNSGKGIDTSISFGFDPNNQISTLPCVGGITQDEMELKYVVGTPALCSVSNWLPDTPPTVIGQSGPYDFYQQTFVDFTTQLFQFWSGSYKFKIYITASNMHSVKGVFYLSDSPESDNWENDYHRVVDIQGDTEVDIMIPYTNALCVSKLNNLSFGLYFRILSWSQASGASSPISLNTYKAGGSDFRFGTLREVQFTVESNPRKDFSKEFEPLHPSMTGYIPTDLFYGEEFTTLREVIHRYWAYGVTNNTNVPAFRRVGTRAVNVYSGIELIGLIYRFWRGSVRWKFIQKDTTPRIVVPYLEDGAVKITGVMMSSAVNPVIDCSVPYYSDLLMQTTRSANDSRIGVLTDPRAGTFELKSAGDDFSFHYLCAPPQGMITQLPDTYGWRNLRTFLST